MKKTRVYSTIISLFVIIALLTGCSSDSSLEVTTSSIAAKVQISEATRARFDATPTPSISASLSLITERSVEDLSYFVGTHQ